MSLIHYSQALTVEQHAFAKAEAVRIGISLNAYIRLLVDQAMRGNNA